MMTYKEYKDASQMEFNALPIFFAFGRDQFKAAMEERGLTENDTDKIYALGAGGYYLKEDAPIIRAYFVKPDKLNELMKNSDFALDAIYYEMCNHEYCINWQAAYDVCSCFGSIEYKGDELDPGEELTDYFNQLKWTDATRAAYMAAHRKYMKDALENDWV